MDCRVCGLGFEGSFNLRGPNFPPQTAATPFGLRAQGFKGFGSKRLRVLASLRLRGAATPRVEPPGS